MSMKSREIFASSIMTCSTKLRMCARQRAYSALGSRLLYERFHTTVLSSHVRNDAIAIVSEAFTNSQNCSCVPNVFWQSKTRCPAKRASSVYDRRALWATLFYPGFFLMSRKPHVYYIPLSYDWYSGMPLTGSSTSRLKLLSALSWLSNAKAAHAKLSNKGFLPPFNFSGFLLSQGEATFTLLLTPVAARVVAWCKFEASQPRNLIRVLFQSGNRFYTNMKRERSPWKYLEERHSSRVKHDRCNGTRCPLTGHVHS